MPQGTVPLQVANTGSAPITYTVPASQELLLQAVRAVFDGTGAAGAFLPAVQILNSNGAVMAQTVGDSVAAGGSADASFFPLIRRKIIVGGVTYAQQIILLKASYTCVAEWQLDEGATPYADTSGFAPADPATLVRQVRATAMTQNFASGPLNEAVSGPSVAFNFDGTIATGSGDFLQDTDATPSRFTFAGNLPFTLIAWVYPGAGVNTHRGPALDNLVGIAGPKDNGWRLGVNQPTLVPQFERAPQAAAIGNYDIVTGAALTANQWQMLAATYDGATMRLYVNGTLAGSGASAGAIGAMSNNVTVGVGIAPFAGGGTWYYGGLAQCSVWAATLTATDIATLYAAASV